MRIIDYNQKQEISEYLSKYYIKISQDEIREMFNDRQANKEKIACSQLLFVHQQCNKFNNIPHLSPKELFAEGLYILSNAIDKYNPESEATFTSYLGMALNNVLAGLFNRNTYEIIKPPTKQTRDSHPEGKVFSTARTFSSFKTPEGEDGEDLNIEDTFDGDVNKTPKQVCGDKLETLIRNSVTKESDVEFVLRHFGINGRPETNKITLANQEGCTIQNMRQKLTRIFNNLRNNKEFETVLRRYIEETND